MNHILSRNILSGFHEVVSLAVAANLVLNSSIAQLILHHTVTVDVLKYVSRQVDKFPELLDQLLERLFPLDWSAALDLFVASFSRPLFNSLAHHFIHAAPSFEAFERALAAIEEHHPVTASEFVILLERVPLLSRDAARRIEWIFDSWHSRASPDIKVLQEWAERYEVLYDSR